MGAKAQDIRQEIRLRHQERAGHFLPKSIACPCFIYVSISSARYDTRTTPRRRRSQQLETPLIHEHPGWLRSDDALRPLTMPFWRTYRMQTCLLREQPLRGVWVQWPRFCVKLVLIDHRDQQTQGRSRWTATLEEARALLKSFDHASLQSGYLTTATAKQMRLPVPPWESRQSVL
jgi:hypothetical protein